MDENTGYHRALRNPLVMVGLCLLAGLAVYHNVIKSTMNTTLPDSVDSAPLPRTTGQTFLASPSHKVHDTEATQWIDHPNRDPFTPTAGTAETKPSTNRSTTISSRRHVRRLEPPKHLELKAIALESQHRSAVINRSVVHEGEMIEGYQVDSIGLKGVWLQRHGKKHLLTFPTHTTS